MFLFRRAATCLSLKDASVVMTTASQHHDKKSSLAWIRKQISLYYNTERPVSTILEIDLNIERNPSDTGRFPTIDDKAGNAAREHMMGVFQEYLSREYSIPAPVRIEWSSEKKGSPFYHSECPSRACENPVDEKSRGRREHASSTTLGA